MKYNNEYVRELIINYIDTINQLLLAEKLVEDLKEDRTKYDRENRIKDYSEVVERQKEKEIELREKIGHALQA